MHRKGQRLVFLFTLNTGFLLRNKGTVTLSVPSDNFWITLPVKCCASYLSCSRSQVLRSPTEAGPWCHQAHICCALYPAWIWMLLLIYSTAHGITIELHRAKRLVLHSVRETKGVTSLANAIHLFMFTASLCSVLSLCLASPPTVNCIWQLKPDTLF